MAIFRKRKIPYLPLHKYPIILMAPEAPTEQPASPVEAAKQALAAAKASLIQKVQAELAAGPQRPSISAALNQLAAAVTPDAVKNALTTLQADPNYLAMSEATRTQLETLRTTIGTTTKQVTDNIPEKALTIGGKVWDYVKYPLTALGGFEAGRMLIGGTKTVGGWVKNGWDKFWDFCKSGAKLGLAAGAGALAYIGATSLYHGSQEEKPKTM